MNDNISYVYEHWRPDRDECFYVGKGSGSRANDMKRSRNRHHKAISAKLSRLGMCVEVRMIANGLTEDEAFALEIERIAFWRADGADLANITPGGDGVRGIRHTDEFKEAARIRWLGRKHTEESRQKMREAALGKVRSPETRAKMSAAHTGRVWDREIIERRRITQTGLKRGEGTKAKLKAMWESPEFRAKRAATIAERRALKVPKEPKIAKTYEEICAAKSAAKLRYWEKRKSDPNHKERMAAQMARTWETRRNSTKEPV